MASPDFAHLRAALDRLRRCRRLAVVAARVRQQGAAIHAQLQRTLLEEVPAFMASHDEATLGALDTHILQQQGELNRLLAGGAVGDFGFACEHGRLRAQHRFPLEAMLHGCRCAHKVFAQRLRQAASAPRAGAAALELAAALADFAIEFADAVSRVAAAAYVEQIRLAADVADQRAQLLDIVLGGYDESDARVAAILRGAGWLDHRQSFCVVLAQSVDSAEMANPARARRLADTLDQLVPTALARRRLIELRESRVVAVFSGVARASGWTRPSASLAARIAELLATAGNAVLIGVSGDVASTSRVPSALRQALLALRLTGLTRRVVSFAQIPLRQLMMHLAGEELQRLLPPWAGEFYAADDRLGGALSATLRAYADADMNLLKAGARLALHPNTVYARMNRIRDLTGLNARSYAALTDLITVADARAAPP